MTLNLEELKKIDESSILVVFGYMRELHKQLKSTYKIPSLISWICLKYFYSIDYFEIIGQHTVLTEDKSTITKTHWGWTCTSYGKLIIPSMDNIVIKWFLRLVEAMDGNIIIGIQSNCTDINQTFIWNKTDDRYYGLYLATGNKHQNELDYRKRSQTYVPNRIRYMAGDIISLELNLVQRTVKFWYNDYDLGIAFANIEKSDDVKYR
eukprot:350590_1